MLKQRGSVFVEIALVLGALVAALSIFFALVPRIVQNQGSAESIRALANLREPLVIAELRGDASLTPAAPAQVISEFKRHLWALQESALSAEFCAFFVAVRSANVNDCSDATVEAFSVVDLGGGVFDFTAPIDISQPGSQLINPFGVRMDGSECSLAPPDPALEEQLLRSLRTNPCTHPTPMYLYAVYDSKEPDNFDIRGSLSMHEVATCTSENDSYACCMAAVGLRNSASDARSQYCCALNIPNKPAGCNASSSSSSSESSSSSSSEDSSDTSSTSSSSSSGNSENQARLNSSSSSTVMAQLAPGIGNASGTGGNVEL